MLRLCNRTSNLYSRPRFENLRSFPKYSTQTEKLDSVKKKTLPSSVHAVIIGGGVIGASVGYHLTKFGITDVVLLEQGVLTSGTTWHAAGLIGQMRNTQTEIALSTYGTQLYEKLEEETMHSTGFKRCGSISVARTKDRMHNFSINLGRARAFGIEAHIVTPEECKKLIPFMRIDDILGGLWLPGDGTATSSDVCQSLAKGAKNRGMKIFEHTQVAHVNTHYVGNHPEVHSVTTTDNQTVKCKYVVNCAGQWACQLGKQNGINIPLHSAEHFYVVTQPFGVDPNLPLIRDQDGYIYAREWSGGMLWGGFEPEAKPCFTQGVPNSWQFGLFEEDWDQFKILLDSGILRMPILESVGIRQMVNGPESFTPDTHYLLGEVPEVSNYFVAAGFNSSGIASAGGAGKAIAEWIIAGSPTMDLWAVDIKRFGKYQNNIMFLRERTVETLGLHYALNWPRREMTSGRPSRLSPLYHQLKEAGACFGSKLGWERPNWFAPKGIEPKMEYSWGRQNWFPYTEEEVKHTRTHVSLFDQTSFSKLLVQGRDAEKILQRLCANNVGVPDGRVIYTGMLNERGGFETDCTVMRIDRNQFLIVTATSQGVRDMDWIRRHIPSDALCTITDVTSAYAVISVMGPDSRALLSELTSAKLDNLSFPFGTHQQIDVHLAVVRAARITFVGELGWELYIPTELAYTVYEALHHHGRKWGLRNAGYYAIEAMRLEKGYRSWSHDISPDDTPLEAGLSFAVDFEKDFIGKERLLAQQTSGITRRLVQFQFNTSPEAYPLGREPIYDGDEIVGSLSSAAYGHTLGYAIGMGYVKYPQGIKQGFLNGKNYQIEILGHRYPVAASLTPSYDPKNTKIK